MADFIGKPITSSTAGEKKLYRILKLAFDNETDVRCYYEPIIGDDCPDFVLLSPAFGVVVFEVKDYLEYNLVAVSKGESWILAKDGKEINCNNPFAQVYQYWRDVQNYFAKKLVRQAVVFTKISSCGEAGDQIFAKAPSKVTVFFKEDLASVETFLAKFDQHIPRDLQLTNDEFKLLHGNLFPMARLPSTRQTRLLLDPILEPDELQLLDAEQEKLANGLGDGHRLFFGVAGSGKTVVLAARARYLAKRHENWRILVVCYNKLLADAIRKMVNPQQYDAAIFIWNYHVLAKNIIKAAGSPFDVEYARGLEEARNEPNLFFTTIVPELFARAVDVSDPPKYDAILIDEAQDFEASWYRPLLALLNPDTNSLLVTLDGLQGIYARKRYRWSDIGIRARGRVVKLRKTYRNPETIGRAAGRVLPQELVDLTMTDEEFLATEEYARPGGELDVSIHPSRDDEYKFLAGKIHEFLAKNYIMIVIFRQNMQKIQYHHPFFDVLKTAGIDWMEMTNEGRNASTILIGTPQATKGLEADVVIIPEADRYTTTSDQQLLYVGMTRATRVLVITAIKETELLKKVKQ